MNSDALKVLKSGENFPVNVLFLNRQEGRKAFPMFDELATKFRPSIVPENVG